MLNHLTGGWIEVPNRAIAVARVPHLSVAIDEQAMGLCSCWQVPLAKSFCVGVEARDLVAVHDRNIDVAIWSRRGVAREFGCWHLPLSNLPFNLWPTSRCDAIVRPASPGYASREEDQPNDNAALYV